jgi:hypothetical protein
MKNVIKLVVAVIIISVMWLYLISQKANYKASLYSLPLENRSIQVYLFSNGSFRPCLKFSYEISGVQLTYDPYISYGLFGNLIDDRLRSATNETK